MEANALDTAVVRLEAAGYTVKDRGDRLCLCDEYGRDVGYLLPRDLSGGTGTCRNVTRRAGHVVGVLRGERA